MTNSERLLLYTLPRWAGVTVLSIKEPLSDMWLAGVEAGHHPDEPYDPDGSVKLRAELLKDFVKTPSREAFGPGGNVRTVRDLDAAMAGVSQTPVPSAAAMLAVLLPNEEMVTVSRGRVHSAILHQAGKPKKPRTPATRKKSSGRRWTR